jgi:hypothetical protein
MGSIAEFIVRGGAIRESSRGSQWGQYVSAACRPGSDSAGFVQTSTMFKENPTIVGTWEWVWRAKDDVQFPDGLRPVVGASHQLWWPCRTRHDRNRGSIRRQLPRELHADSGITGSVPSRKP